MGPMFNLACLSHESPFLTALPGTDEKAGSAICLRASSPRIDLSNGSICGLALTKRWINSSRPSIFSTFISGASVSVNSDPSKALKKSANGLLLVFAVGLVES